MRNARLVTGLVVSLFPLLALHTAGATEGEWEIAQKLSSETGRPMLVVAGNDT